MILLYALLALLAVVLLAFVAAVATPVHLSLQADFGETAGFTLDIRPFAGLSPRLRLTERILSGKPSRPPKPSGKPPQEKRRKRRSSIARRLIRALPKIVRSTLSRIHIDRLHLDLNFGTGDPAETGWLYGQCMPFVHAWPRLDLVLRPDFVEPCFRGRFAAAVHLTPVAVAWPVLKALAGARP